MTTDVLSILAACYSAREPRVECNLAYHEEATHERLARLPCFTVGYRGAPGRRVVAGHHGLIDRTKGMNGWSIGA